MLTDPTTSGVMKALPVIGTVMAVRGSTRLQKVPASHRSGLRSLRFEVPAVSGIAFERTRTVRTGDCRSGNDAVRGRSIYLGTDFKSVSVSVIHTAPCWLKCSSTRRSAAAPSGVPTTNGWIPIATTVASASGYTEVSRASSET
jgi:hypothetical protein